MESGSDYAIWSYNGPDVHPETYMDHVAPDFNCEKGAGGRVTDEDMMECLRLVTDVHQLRRAKPDCPVSCRNERPILILESSV